jgi:uncharacterized protein (DUF433 family)
MIPDGLNQAEILAAYPELRAEDVHGVLQYAAEAVRELLLVAP